MSTNIMVAVWGALIISHLHNISGHKVWSWVWLAFAVVALIFGAISG